MNLADWMWIAREPKFKSQAPMNIPKHAAQGKKNTKKGGKKK